MAAIATDRERCPICNLETDDLVVSFSHADGKTHRAHLACITDWMQFEGLGKCALCDREITVLNGNPLRPAHTLAAAADPINPPDEEQEEAPVEANEEPGLNEEEMAEENPAPSE